MIALIMLVTELPHTHDSINYVIDRTPQNIDDQLKNINSWYAKKKNDESLTPKQQEKLEKNRVSDNEDIAGMRDRIRGVYGFSEDNIWTRMMRSSRDLNYLRLLGGVTVSSLPDVSRVFMAEGFAKTFKGGEERERRTR